jgi:hypothetical protein
MAQRSGASVTGSNGTMIFKSRSCFQLCAAAVFALENNAATRKRLKPVGIQTKNFV